MKLIFAIIAFLLAGGVFFFYTQPTYSSVGQIQAQIAEYQQALDKATQLEALKQQLLAKYNAFNPSDIARLQTMLPDQVDNIGLILELDDLASHYGMALENVNVSTPDSGSSDPTAVGVVGANSQTYDSLTLQFSTYGTYDEFQSFLKDLESSLRIVDLVSLTISQGAPTGSSAPAPSASSAASYNYQMTIKTYWLK